MGKVGEIAGTWCLWTLCLRVPLQAVPLRSLQLSGTKRLLVGHLPPIANLVRRVT